MTPAELLTRLTRLPDALRAVFDLLPGGVAAWPMRLGGLPQAELEDWLAERALPTPKQLYHLWQIMRDMHTGAAVYARLQFADMLRAPAKDVSSLGALMHPTVGHYMLAGLRESAVDALATVSPYIQEELLLALIRKCRKLRDPNDPANLYADLHERLITAGWEPHDDE